MLNFWLKQSYSSKANQIKTILSSLSIEGNTLSEEQITAILENKRIAGPQKDIIEVLNALNVYKNLATTKIDKKRFSQSTSISDERPHRNPGKYRTKSVGIVKVRSWTYCTTSGKSFLFDERPFCIFEE